MNWNQTCAYELRLQFTSVQRSWKHLLVEVFAGRGKDDFQSSHDLEDLMAVVDGRAELVDEIRTGAEAVRAYIAAEIRKLLAVPEFLDALPGYLLPDQVSQARVSVLLERLKKIAAF